MPTKPTETNQRGGFPSSSFKYTPLQHLRWLYARFIQGLFHAAPPGAYHWEPNENSTEIIVSNENVIDAERVGVRPAITFTRGAVRFYTLGHDDMLGYDLRTGQKEKGVLVPGVMSVNCMSREDLESEQLAWIVAEQLWMNRDMLMKYGFFEVGREAVVGAVSPAGSLVTNDGGKEWYVTTVSCPFQFYRTGTLTPLGKAIVRGIELCLSTGMQTLPAPNASYPLVPGHPEQLPYSIIREFPPPYTDASDVYGGTPDGNVQPTRENLVPHPLNPSQFVTVRPAFPNRLGPVPPTINGRRIPISTTPVEESPVEVEVSRPVKSRFNV
jgi:hypothetical protein